MSNKSKSGDSNLDKELTSNIFANEEGKPLSDDHEDEKQFQLDFEEEFEKYKLNGTASENKELTDREKELLVLKAKLKEVDSSIKAIKMKLKETSSSDVNNLTKQLENLNNDRKSIKSLIYERKSRVKTRPELMNSDILLSVRNLKQFFFFGSGPSKTKLKAVSNVSFDVHAGECFGIVGESGCGKTTTGRSIIKLYDITSGSVYYKGYRISAGDRWNKKEIKYTKIRLNEKKKVLAAAKKEELSKLDKLASNYQQTVDQINAKYKAQLDEAIKFSNEIITKQKEKIKSIRFDNKHTPRKLVNEIQMIFQDPIDSLDPRKTVEDIIQEGLRIQGFKNREENHRKVVEMLEKVGLVAEHASRYPHEFSGGQRQRIGIARALIMNPKLLICDEPISALDVSIRAQIINLLNDLKEEYGLTIIFIAHDLSVVKYFCDRIAVMYYGKVVELSSSEELFLNPLHPYTKSLLSAIPKPNPIIERTRERIIYQPNEVHDYSVDKPELKMIKENHFIYCNEAEFEKYKKELH